MYYDGNRGEPVNEVGESGIIYVSGLNEHVKVVAVFSDTEDGSGKGEYKYQFVFDGVI